MIFSRPKERECLGKAALKTRALQTLARVGVARTTSRSVWCASDLSALSDPSGVPRGIWSVGVIVKSWRLSNSFATLSSACVVAIGLTLATLPVRAQASTPPALPQTRVTGTVERLEKLESKHVAPRYVDVWLPPGYSLPKAKRHRYPVIYLHDGQNVFDPASSFIGVDWGIDETMTRLIAEKKIPEAIIVAIWNTPKRLSEYMPQKAIEQIAEADLDAMFKSVRREPLGDAYLRYLVTELKPAIDARYRTRPDRAHTSLMGSSMGGLISLYAVCEYPDVFGGAACLSTAWQVANGVTVRELKKSLPDPRTHRLYFDFGTGTNDGSIEPFQQQVDALLKESGYVEGKNWVTQKFPGEEHSERAWRKRVHLPLQFLLSR